jgi:hypothetical protein
VVGDQLDSGFELEEPHHLPGAADAVPHPTVGTPR